VGCNTQSSQAGGQSLHNAAPTTVSASAAIAASFNPSYLLEARTLFERALALDPGNVDAIVGEALANVARHADAHRVSVAVHVDAGAIELQVRDDGHGVQAGRRGGHGIANLEARARALGGSCRLEATAGGARLQWQVPISD